MEADRFLNRGRSWVLLVGMLPAAIAVAGAVADFSGMEPTLSETGARWVEIDEERAAFVFAESKRTFIPWGVNYDHDRDGRLLEDYWGEEWETVAKDFEEIKRLGGNVVRIHLQVSRFLTTASKANRSSLRQLERLIKLAETNGLYLNLTGLGCYHKGDVPEWYDQLSEGERWQAQAFFWESVASTCAWSPVVFCYDLMNEPILPGNQGSEVDWLAGQFGGKHFVQRIAKDLRGRTRREIARAWVAQLVAAIRRVDQRHLITVGVIPWAHTWPNAKPVFYSPEVSELLDFVSVHFYPEAGEVERALEALKVYEIGKPLVVEEMFPLKCKVEELDAFIEGGRGFVDGWFGFYWGMSLREFSTGELSRGDAITKEWLRYFHAKTKTLRDGD